MKYSTESTFIRHKDTHTHTTKIKHYISAKCLWLPVPQRIVHLKLCEMKFYIYLSNIYRIFDFIIQLPNIQDEETEGYFSINSIISLCLPSPKSVCMPLNNTGISCRYCRKWFRTVSIHSASICFGFSLPCFFISGLSLNFTL